MKCEICGWSNGCDPYVHAMDDRIARLEAKDLAAAVLKSGPRESDSRPPDDESGRTAAAVTSPAIPDGFALASGWEAYSPGRFECGTCGTTVSTGGGNMAFAGPGATKYVCRACAVETGALGAAEPSGTSGELPAPAPQPEAPEERERLLRAQGFESVPTGFPGTVGAALGLKPQPEAPVGYKVVGRSCRCWPPLKPGQQVRDADTGALVAHPGSKIDLRRWEEGAYDILEPLPAEPPSDACGEPRPGGGSRATVPAEPPSETMEEYERRRTAKVAESYAREIEEDGRPPAERPAPEVATSKNCVCLTPRIGCPDMCTQACRACHEANTMSPAPSEPAKRPPRISDEEREKRRPWPHPAVLMNAMEMDAAKTYVCDLCSATTDALDGGKESGPPENFWACAKCAPGMTGKTTGEPAKAPLSERMRRDREELKALLLKWKDGPGGDIGTLARFGFHENEVADLEARIAYAEKRCREIRSTRDEALKAAVELRMERFDLAAKLADAEKERDEYRARWRTSDSTLAVAIGDVTEIRDDARANIAEERTRCVTLLREYIETRASLAETLVAIASGAPAPTVTP